jgi:UDP-2,3-diacylglucosamine hydrolase
LSTLLLSDLHLPTQPSPLRQGFARFLAGPARQARSVYILGDLFEYWVGDDAGLRDYAAETAALRSLSDSGVRIGLMHGNRDFMVGRRFAAAAGVELLRDPLRVEIEGVPTLLSHGDVFCTDDIPYQRWRSFSRNKLAQSIFRLMPESARRGFGGSFRSRSEQMKTQKVAKTIVDVNDGAIRQAFKRHGVPRMIHGHTHRPAEHAHDIDGSARLRIVLADWRPGRMEYLACDTRGWRRLDVAATA